MDYFRQHHHEQPHEVVQPSDIRDEGDFYQRPVIAYLSVYEVHRCYGGPEEGGWWYDAYEFTGVSFPFTAEQQYERNLGDDEWSGPAHTPVGLPIVTNEPTRVMLQSMRMHLASIYGDPDGKQERFSVNGGADIAFYYELQPGARETKERPRYE